MVLAKNYIMSLIEHHFNCPCCFANISMLLDLSVSKQQYIEDCEVCCRPIEINFEIQERKIAFFAAQPSDEWCPM